MSSLTRSASALPASTLPGASQHRPPVVMKGSGDLPIQGCRGVAELPANLQHGLQTLLISECRELEVVDLRGLDALRQLRITSCSNCVEVKGLKGRNPQLEVWQLPKGCVAT
jgi:hypothetical protein